VYSGIDSHQEGDDTIQNMESTVSKEEIERRVGAFSYWYHRIALPHGVVTPGWSPFDEAAYDLPATLAGKRVLDVGAWDGFWTFKAAALGAREVVAIDDFSDHLSRLEPDDRRAWETFDLCREVLGYDHKTCARREMSVYDVTEASLGRFDVIFLFGTLYHLRHPLLALDRLASVCDGEIFVECAILDDYSPYRGGLGQGYPDGQMVMEFYPDDLYGRNASNWWVPTLQCLLRMVESAGFSQETRSWKLTCAPDRPANCRGFVRGRVAYVSTVQGD
jgi:tRNA (mo5U34)-methyltransferase